MSTHLRRPAAGARSSGLIAAAFLVVACGSAPGPSAAPTAPPSVAPSAAPSESATVAVLLKVTTEGGFINPAATLNALPIVEVLSDGRILTPGPVDAIAPGPLLAPVTVRDTGAAGAAAILAAIHDAGLDQPATGGPGVPGDSGTDIFTVTIGDEIVETRISGNGPGIGGPGVPGGGGSQDPAKAAAFALLERLVDPTEAWGGPVAPPVLYAPSGYRVYVSPGAPGGDPATVQKPVAWPLTTPLATFGTAAVPDRGVTGLRQGVVLGPDAVRLGPILAAATVETPFTSGGASFTLAVRDLLPDEVGS